MMIHQWSLTIPKSQFQISIKAPLAVNIFDTFDVYVAYTNRSFWQLYNSETLGSLQGNQP